MKELIIKTMENSRKNLLKHLQEEGENLDESELNQILDSLLEIDKILKSLKS
jgi:hypothetical protein